MGKVPPPPPLHELMPRPVLPPAPTSVDHQPIAALMPPQPELPPPPQEAPEPAPAEKPEMDTRMEGIAL